MKKDLKNVSIIIAVLIFILGLLALYNIVITTKYFKELQTNISDISIQLNKLELIDY